LDRLHRALDFIDRHLSEPLDLERIAGAAAISPHHFSRLFRRVMGDTVMGHLRRRRLRRAAQLMRDGKDRLLDIALDVGFDSQEAFHRAFKRTCGITPGAYRRLAPDVRAAIDLLLVMPLPKEITAMTELTPRFTDKEAFTLIGLTQRFAQGRTEDIPALWEGLMARFEEIPNQIPGRAYGFGSMIEDDEGAFDYMAAVEVEADSQPPEGMVRRQVPALHYAVFTHKVIPDEKGGEPDLSTQLPRSMNHIFGVWLPASGRELAAGFDFELYGERFDPATKTGEIDIYVPVLRQA